MDINIHTIITFCLHYPNSCNFYSLNNDNSVKICYFNLWMAYETKSTSRTKGY